jgi:ferredoxin
MPKKYHIDVQPTPNRFPAIGRSGIIDWGEGCLKCAKCVKDNCVYGVYKERKFSSDILADNIDSLCKDCFRCVQGCPKRLIHKTINPEWESLGDDVFTPEIIGITWTQAETGKIPVSGAGYGGSFSGPGFDSMWTDMSEIVRPTRDGIHGREYISTVIDIGRHPMMLKFDEKGKLLSKPLPSLRIPIPILFDLLPFGDLSDNVWKAMAHAAATIDTMMIVPLPEAEKLSRFSGNLVPYVTSEADFSRVSGFKMVEIPYSDRVLKHKDKLKALNPNLLVSVRIPGISRAETIAKITEYTRAGIDLIHVAADERGYEPGVENALHVRDIIKEVNASLLSEGIRDEITVMISGGIAMAEHVTKALLCGANIVGVDIPLLIALECRLCRNCLDELECPAKISQIEPAWGSKRIVNLIGAWHNQLLEMMGAMGIREARRLRGEQGRCMFMEDLETDTFAKLFTDRI